MEPGYAQDLRDTVTRAAAALRAMPEETVRARKSPDKWSAAEIIGHLVDSASNNHQRFVRAGQRTDLRFDGYDQESWVRAQDYQNAPWLELITLWESFNLHLARVMDCVPDDVRTRSRTDHNLDRIAWETVRADEAVTLDYFMQDYTAHLKHHLRQISPHLAAEPERQRVAGPPPRP